MYSASYQSTCRYGTPDFGYDGCLFGDSNARAATAVVDQSLHKLSWDGVPMMSQLMMDRFRNGLRT